MLHELDGPPCPPPDPPPGGPQEETGEDEFPNLELVYFGAIENPVLGSASLSGSG